MAIFAEFEQYLREGLAHLYDPTYQPSPLLWEILSNDPRQDVRALQARLMQEIESLKPAPTVPPTARARQIYDVLTARYLQKLTQEEAAVSLGITARTVRRIQQQAVNLLARRLWEQSHPDAPLPNVDALLEDETILSEDEKSAEWRAQLREELTYIQQSAPGLVTDVGEVMQGVVEVGRALTSKHDVNLKAIESAPGLMTTAQASILRLALIRAIERLVEHMSSGEVTMQAVAAGEQVKITVTGQPATATSPPYSDFVQETLATQGGLVEVYLKDDWITFEITLPSAHKVIVLVVDDNADLVHFYRRYVAGTRYEIVHLAEGQRLFEQIAASIPDIIVLDVMLPGVDGWELLTHLHEYPTTRSIPVIICSVVRGREMASALGAALYLQKPVRSRQFVEALDRVLEQE